MGSKKGQTLNDLFFDYVYNSTFYPELLAEGEEETYDRNLKELLKTARSKKEARNILVHALRENKKKGDGNNLIKQALLDYSDNHGYSDMPVEFNLDAERLYDLDPATMGVDEAMEAADQMAAAFGYDPKNGGTEQMLKDLYGDPGDVPPEFFSKGDRAFLEKFGKLSDVLKKPMPRDDLYQQLGLTPTSMGDDEYLYDYLGKVAKRANAIRNDKKRPGWGRTVGGLLMPYTQGKDKEGREASLVDQAFDLAGLIGTGGAVKLASKPMKRQGLGAVISGVMDGLHDMADSATTTHTYTLVENGKPDYTERGKVEVKRNLADMAKSAIAGAAMASKPARRFVGYMADLPPVAAARKFLGSGFDAIFGGKTKKQLRDLETKAAKSQKSIEKAEKEMSKAAEMKESWERDVQKLKKRNQREFFSPEKSEKTKREIEQAERVSKEYSDTAEKQSKKIEREQRKLEKIPEARREIMDRDPAKKAKNIAQMAADYAIIRANGEYSLPWFYQGVLPVLFGGGGNGE